MGKFTFELEKTIYPVLKDFFKGKDIIALYLFGSMARKEESPRDIDIAVLIGLNFCENEKERLEKISEFVGKLALWKEKLKKELGYPVDIVILELLPIEAQLTILKEGILLYYSDWDLLTNYIEDLSRRAIETMVNRLALKERREELYEEA